jgi:hypothetical protein
MLPNPPAGVNEQCAFAGSDPRRQPVAGRPNGPQGTIRVLISDRGTVAVRGSSAGVAREDSKPAAAYPFQFGQM